MFIINPVRSEKKYPWRRIPGRPAGAEDFSMAMKYRLGLMKIAGCTQGQPTGNAK